MTAGPRPVSLWFARALAVIATLWLCWAVAKSGVELIPPELDPVRITWDFRDSETPLWDSPNGRTSRGPQGLILVAGAEPALMTSGPLDNAPRTFGRMRVRLSLRHPAQGQVGLVVRSPDGVTRVTASFEVSGGGKFEDVVVPIPWPDRPNLRVVQAVLVPSVIPQSATVTGIRFEPDEAFMTTAIREVLSPSPGRTASLQGSSVNSLPPPVVNGRSVWLALTPIVLVAGMLARMSGGSPGVRAPAHRVGWACVAAVWSLGVGLTVYHQAVALAADVESFGGGSRAAAYGVIDGAPLWEDVQAIARVLPSGSTVRVVIGAAGEDRLGAALWTGRAAYYLYPVPVRPSAPVTIYYVGGSHPPCAQVASGLEVLDEASRYCLLRTAS